MNFLKRRVSACALVVLLLTPLASSSFAQADPADDSSRFKAFFAAALGITPPDPRLDYLVLAPQFSRTPVPGVTSWYQRFFTELDRRARSETPVALFEEGKKRATPMLAGAGGIDDFIRRNSAPGEELTVVVFPGVLGGLIRNRAYEEIFAREHSAYQKRFQQKLSALPRKSPLRTDPRYSLKDLRNVPIPIEEVLHVSSLDGADGRPLVNFLLFDLHLMSLDSVGDTAEMAAVFVRRMEKFFQITGTPKKIVFLGYSRGAMLALEALSEAQKQEKSWLKNVVAMVSVGGVLQGSDLADAARNTSNAVPAPVSHQQLNLLTKFTEELQTLRVQRNGLESARLLLDNTRAWNRFLVEMLKVSGRAAASEFSAREGIPSIQDVKRNFEIFIDSNRTLELTALAATGYTIFFENFNLLRFFREYDRNVVRWVKAVRAVEVAISQLTTESRLQWWKSHTIPVRGIRYYAIAGTMADPLADDPVERDLAENPYGFDSRLPDYQQLLLNYRDFKSQVAYSLNDSQVASHKARFWPEIAATLNPKQKPYSASFLGLVGTHHWGLALKEVTPLKGDEKGNPFPRVEMLKAISAQILDDRAKTRN